MGCCEFLPFEGQDIGNLVLSCIAFLTALMLFPLTLRKFGHYLNTTARGAAVFGITFGLFLLAVLFHLIGVILAKLDLQTLSRGQRKDILKFLIFTGFVDIQAFATITLTQYGFITANQQDNVGDLTVMTINARIWTVFAYGLITVLNFGHQIAYQLRIDNIFASNPSGTDGRPIWTLEFIIYLLLGIITFATFTYAVTNKQVSRASVYFYVLGSCAQSFARAVFDMVIAGVYVLPQVEDEEELQAPHESIPILGTIIRYILTIFALGCMLEAARRDLTYARKGTQLDDYEVLSS